MIEIEDLVAFEERRPGSDAERRAAGHLKQRLTALGRDAQVEPIWIFPRWATAHSLHASLAVVGSAVAVKAPLAGAIVLAVTLVATVLDLTGTLYLLRRLAGKRASQNVTSREQSERPGNVYCADPEAREVTEQLIRDAGFEPVDAGDLESARAMEDGLALLIALSRAGGPVFSRYWRP